MSQKRLGFMNLLLMILMVITAFWFMYGNDAGKGQLKWKNNRIVTDTLTKK